MNSKTILLAIMLIGVYCCHPSNAQTLRRQALIDFTVKIDPGTTNPIKINEIPSSSQFYLAGLRTGDRIISINDLAITNTVKYQKAVRKWRGGEKNTLQVNRDGKIINITCIPAAKPIEVIENLTTTYDEAKTKAGYSVRMIVTKPKNAGGKLPVIFFVQWLSCDQVELDRNNMDGWAYLIEDLASKTGCILVRTEKPGLGDSNGPDCSECDLNNEIDAYKASFQRMMTYDFVDKNNIVVVGGSIGGALETIVAEGQNIKGLISTGGFSTTWYEHILNFERNRLFYSGSKPEQIDFLIKKFSSFYYEYLIRKRKPSEIIESNPFYKSLWYQANDLQFGRPAKYYQQLQDLNMSYYWNKIICPVLIVYGEYDWIMSKAEQENVVRLLKAQRAGNIELKVISGMNHNFSKYASAQEAFEESFVKYESKAFEVIKNWLRSVIGI